MRYTCFYCDCDCDFVIPRNYGQDLGYLRALASANDVFVDLKQSFKFFRNELINENTL